ncbi:iron-containing redox enzyme family protein [Nocardia acidivorans]|uniref:iron-containing redox enzyme family protein n=1 Tax=Nocardia acidivorans TaxID=404580 RepID=UPI0008349B00|nr:iron-containing redox enzyme family protein [Nocardia acidivorans]
MADSQAFACTAVLPPPRGEVSAALVEILRRLPAEHPSFPDVVDPDPYGEDLQLALHLCYELHYHGFEAVDPAWEWDPELLRLRAELERPFLDALRGDVKGGEDVREELSRLLIEPIEAADISQYLLQEGDWAQLREYLAQRSIYHHKEGDPHAWAIPRLFGQEKASLVAVEFDEFGGGRGERLHAQLFRDLLTGAGLDNGYLHYLDSTPAPMLAVVNMMSLFGLHRRWRGALVGQLANAEITSSPSARRMVEALEKLNAPIECVRFYAEHVEADAVHEQVMRHDVVENLLRHEPALAESVAFGIQATNLLEDRFSAHVLGSWRAGQSSLRVTT